MSRTPQRRRQRNNITFLTTLPIEVCRERIRALQDTSDVARRHHNAPSTRDPAFSTFTLAQFYHFDFWQRWMWWESKCRLSVRGTLSAVPNGTQVHLRLTRRTRLRLWLETGLAWSNMLFVVLWVAGVGFALVREVFYVISGRTSLAFLMNGEEFGWALLTVLIVVFWSVGATVLVRGLWSRHIDLKIAARSLFGTVRRKLEES